MPASCSSHSGRLAVLTYSFGHPLVICIACTSLFPSPSSLPLPSVLAGVSYMFPNDDVIYAHISSKFSSSNTSSKRFEENITKALADMKATVEQHMAAKVASKGS